MKPLSFPQAVRLVAVRELTERARDRSFLVSTLVTLLIVIGVAVVPPLLGAGDRPTYDVAFAGADASALRSVAERQAGALGVQLEVREDPTGDAAALRDDVQNGRLDAVLDADTVLVREELGPELGAVLVEAHRQVRAEQGLRGAGLDPAAVQAASTVPPPRVEALDPPDPGAAGREGLAFFATILLYGQLIGYGFWVALGVVEEKSSRVVEVLLATVSPRALMAGKILGIGLLGLGQLLVVAAIGAAAGAASGAIELDSQSLRVIALVLGWFLLGYAFYAALFAAAAARVSRQEDLQNVTTPTTLLVVVSFFAALYVGSHADSLAARVLALLPPFSVLVNPVRVAAGETAAWEIVVAIVLMLLATAALVVAAARLYEGAILRMGGRVTMREAWRGARGAPSSAVRP